jgi:hypothetical protein
MPEPASTDPAFEYRRGRTPEGRPPGTVAIIAPWYAFLGGAAAWVVQFMVVYAIAEIGCGSERLDAVLLGVPASAFFGFAVTLVAALTALGAAVVAFAMFPEGARADPVDHAGEHETVGRRRFMAYAGLIMNGVFLIAILATGLPFMFLRSCA